MSRGNIVVMQRLTNLLTLREVAGLLGVQEATLRQWRARGRGPASFKIGVSVVYRRSDVDAWLEEHAS